MGALSDDLRSMGYERTEQESPFDEDGELWTKGYEAVCDETGIVVGTDSDNPFRGEDDDDTIRYHGSGKVRLPGGFVGSYHWGRGESGFRYDLR